ncbi:MAG TPA: hypothetical protein VMS60_04475 [Solirubrobacterales bacterium]|nr:hypothetical protein [Solirubrobacterales bacterium]
MTSKFRTPTFVLLGALLVALAAPAYAGAEYYVPPGNSAANQYTETLPSAGGDSGGKKKGKATPAATLGAGNAKKLEDQGPSGKAAAQLAAETAPATVPVTEAPSNDSGGNGTPAGAGKASGNGGPGGEGGQPANAGGGSSPAPTSVQVDEPSGSSGIGAVLGQATGSADDGSLGLWLPVAIVAAIAGSVAYLVRTRPGRTV